LTAIDDQKIRLLCKYGGRGNCSPHLIAHPSRGEHDESGASIRGLLMVPVQVPGTFCSGDIGKCRAPQWFSAYHHLNTYCECMSAITNTIIAEVSHLVKYFQS
jgi:hypothetical protein